MNLTQELIEKAKATKSVEELLALAKENKIELPEEEAKELWDELNSKPGILRDEELDNVSGGACAKVKYGTNTCPECGGVLLKNIRVFCTDAYCQTCHRKYRVVK